MKEKGEPILELSANGTLLGLESKGGYETLRALMGLFLELTPKRISRMKRSFDASDFESLGKEARSLRLSSTNLGATRLSSACRDLEGVENRRDRTQAEALLDRIETEYRVLAEILTELARASSGVRKAAS